MAGQDYLGRKFTTVLGLVNKEIMMLITLMERPE